MSILSCNITYSTGNFNLAADFTMNSKVLGIMGPSGCGKTTLLHLISGFLTPDTGSVQVNERYLFYKKEKINISLNKRKIGYVFQDSRLFPHLSVRKNILYGKFKNNADTGNRFNELIKILELTDMLHHKPHQLSGGQKQRVAIARAIMQKPELLILDEPFAALDARMKNNLMNYLIRLFDTIDLPVIIVSHDLQDLLHFTDDLLILNTNKIYKPAKYHSLLKDGQLFELNGSIRGFYNVFKTTVKEKKNGNAITRVRIHDSDIDIYLESSSYRNTEAGNLIISVRAEDIAIANHKIDEISIRNQIPGTITHIMRRKNHSMCVIDCGKPLVAELTSESIKTLELHEGKKVWCLLKSLAIEVL